ncbi:uncharacterized protein LOC123539594 isoform X2 [Mercenaria mercenaria]|uniref:uncharacterized protein LOC123539594 isoform X2 n=1 Tax=Mercenaria mercenaria TaxID=6596 RepID=UPI00234F5296|nr:uncharacterized protein LOC123539594 isoform X2 [Mercenaria mercenaria]
MMATVEDSPQDQETNRKKFSNWLQCVNALKETKTALHDHVSETFKVELISWDLRIRSHIPQFLRCVAEDRIEIRKTEAKLKGNAKSEWHCNCEHSDSDCNQILKKLLALQQNPGFNIVWKTEICEKLAKKELQIEPDDDDKTDNIPTVETWNVWEFLKRLFDLIGFTSRKQDVEVIKYEDIFDGCTQEHVWCIANMFMQRGKNKTNILNTGPGNTDASMFLKMMMNCKLFEIENENYLYGDVILCRDRLHHSANNRVRQTEAKAYLNTMISCLERFEHVAKCKTAIQNIEKMLQETILSVSVPDENLKRLRQKAEEALKEKKSALEVDQEIDKTSGISSDDTSGMLKETKEQLDSISESQPVEYLNDKMKSREDYKREKAEHDEHRVKQLVTDQRKYSTSTDQTVKDPIKHLEKMANLVKSFPSNLDIAEAVTGQLNPFLDQIVKIAAEKDEEIKESLEEVYEEERQEYELLEKTENSSDFDSESPIPQTKEDDNSVNQDLEDKSLTQDLEDKSVDQDLEDNFVSHDLEDKSLNQDLEDKSVNEDLEDNPANHDLEANSVNNDANAEDYKMSTNQVLEASNSEAASLCCSPPGIDRNHRHIWSVIQTHHCSVRVEGDSTRNSFFTCCRISPTEILLADRINKKLKKLDNSYQVIRVLDLNDWPFDLCYVGDSECVVALPGRKLQFVDATDKMNLTRSLDIKHDCSGLAYNNNHLYVIDDRSVYIYNTDGTLQNVLYTHQSDNSLFRHIAVSDDGGKMYITDLNSGLVTVDSSGNYMNTTFDAELNETWGVCVDSKGHVLVCGINSTNILQISSDGKQKIGTIKNKLDCEADNSVLYFDRQNDVLITTGTSGNITVLKLR